ncbi:MAG: NAD(P)/FAD-dependent oxidoreductase [Candidatus Heimdallarchaeota archaeon]
MEQNSNYSVIIVGCGPAGIFSALQLVKTLSKPHKILMLDSGPRIAERIHNRKREVMQGWGGAGSFSDGKLTLSPQIGGYLSAIISLTSLEQYLQVVEETYVKFGASRDRLVTGRGDAIETIRKKALQFGMSLIPYRLLHIGTDQIEKIVHSMYDHLDNSGLVEVRFRETARELLVDDGHIRGVRTDKGSYHGDFVIVATGRSGAAWLRRESIRLGLSIQNNPVDIGVRVEVPAEITAPLTDLLYEFKCLYYAPTFEQRCRTFCVCPNGEVVKEFVKDPDTNDTWITCNGHSYSDPAKSTPNTNFALLVSSRFTEPFDDPLAYGRSISKLANLLTGASPDQPGTVIIQRLEDLKKGRRSNYERIKRSTIEPTLKEAIPGDLSFVLPYRHLQSILEMLKALDHIIPGVNSSNTLLYGVETKYYSTQIRLTDELETEISGLYTIGDGAGVTRSLAQASVSGLVAARSILSRIEEELSLKQKIRVSDTN